MARKAYNFRDGDRRWDRPARIDEEGPGQDQDSCEHRDDKEPFRSKRKRTVIIDGKVVLENRTVKTIDEAEILKECQKTFVGILNKGEWL